ncbi:hypothetical protein TKK_0009763 [Trichogramma kaykai]
MEYSWVYTKRFEQFKILALQSHKENYDAFIKFALDPEDLTWWKENILHRSKDISDKPREPHPLWRSLTLVVAKLPAKH